MLLTNSHLHTIPSKSTTSPGDCTRDLIEHKDGKYRNDKEYLPRHELWRCRTGTDASEGRDLGGGATSCAGALLPAMVTAKDDDDDDDDACSKGLNVRAPLYRQKHAQHSWCN